MSKPLLFRLDCHTPDRHQAIPRRLDISVPTDLRSAVDRTRAAIAKVAKARGQGRFLLFIERTAVLLLGHVDEYVEKPLDATMAVPPTSRSGL